MTSPDLANKLKAQFGDLLSEPTEFRGEITLNVADAERIVEICAFAKKELGFDYLADISSIDNYGEDPRWTIVYELYGIGNGTYLLRRNPSFRPLQASGGRQIGTNARFTT